MSVSELDKMLELVRWDRFRYRLKKLPYDELSMFQILIFQNLYNLSDRKMEEILYDCLSFHRFCDFVINLPISEFCSMLYRKIFFKKHLL